MGITSNYQNDEIKSLLNLFQSERVNLDLGRIKKALIETGNPSKGIPAIQIAGTNGKGSIASFLETCLKDTDIKIGCTTSPHLLKWHERIRINGEPISHREFQEILLRLQLVRRKFDLTPFELVILSSLHHFSCNEVDLIILEVGLGGRLDATTAHTSRPLIGIGAIGLDHCEQLGGTLFEIAREKAGVISPKSTVVISSIQSKEVKEVFEEVTSIKHAKLKWVKPLTKEWQLGLSGEFQRENAAVAKGLLEELPNLGWHLNEEIVRTGLASAKWPGRLQKVKWRNIPLLLDGAHNPHAASQLAKERLLWSNQEQGIIWIFGIQAHKKGPEIINALLQENDVGLIVPVPEKESWKASDVYKVYPEFSSRLYQKNSVVEVLENLRFSHQDHLPKKIVITGSLILIGEVLKEITSYS